jgi:hypothetical protein
VPATRSLKVWNGTPNRCAAFLIDNFSFKGSNKLCVDKYFDELSAVIHKYNLEDKPHLIYNVDEKGTQANHKPPNVVGSTEYYPPAVTAGSKKE